MSPAAPGPLLLHAVGDIGFGGRLRREAHPDGGSDPFAGASPALEGAHILFGNLETPLVPDGQEPVLPEIRSGFAGAPGHARHLARHGFAIVSLANNHVMDYGPEGLRSTREALRAEGILAVGAGESEEAARRPVVVPAGERRVAFLAYAAEGGHTAGPDGPGAAPLRQEVILEDLALALPGADAVVISLHFGLVYSDYPRAADQALARRLIQAGASVVLGHHPHVLQGLEPCGDGLIAYSLGEFLFDPASGHVVNRTAREIRRETGVLQVALEGRRVSRHRLRPCRQDERSLFPVALSGRQAEAMGRRLAAISEPLATGALDDGELLRATARRTAEHQKDVFLHHLRRGHVGILFRWLLRLRPRHVRMALDALAARFRRG